MLTTLWLTANGVGRIAVDLRDLDGVLWKIHEVHS